ncbi:MAG TPA: TIGR02466 family protein [Alphaproteobacteria bacterium]|nr:TIGR02466 family protein [Alphaproteobacteria bacterium]
MADTGKTTAEFRQLWPTTLLVDRLPGAENANVLLAQIIEDMDARARDMTTDYLSGNFLDIDHPAIKWLGECFTISARQYAQNAGIDYEMDWSIQAWPNVNRFGDYHNLHNHPHSWLSGTYYVQVPSGEPKVKGRSDLNPGAISFFDPRAQANMLAVRGDGQVEAEHRILPETGMILIWPAFLHHLVHPNLFEEARISISFNVVLHWRNSYLP